MIAPGIIVMWSGSIATIPTGWTLCDGTNSTPDLRDRFVIGAGSTYNPDASGGSFSHTHTFTGDGHTHTLPGGPDIQSGASYRNLTDSVPATGTTDGQVTIQPYYALAFIMRI